MIILVPTSSLCEERLKALLITTTALITRITVHIRPILTTISTRISTRTTKQSTRTTTMRAEQRRRKTRIRSRGFWLAEIEALTNSVSSRNDLRCYCLYGGRRT